MQYVCLFAHRRLLLRLHCAVYLSSFKILLCSTSVYCTDATSYYRSHCAVCLSVCTDATSYYRSHCAVYMSVCTDAISCGQLAVSNTVHQFILEVMGPISLRLMGGPQGEEVSQPSSGCHGKPRRETARVSPARVNPEGRLPG